MTIKQEAHRRGMTRWASQWVGLVDAVCIIARVDLLGKSAQKHKAKERRVTHEQNAQAIERESRDDLSRAGRGVERRLSIQEGG
jgi:hypothetical protein